ncbi:ABC transporter [Planococcus antarcticus DSM 14505]|uniref:ABC transporter n=1 Tax=Planococcus antarcticus DSM 14505 TaxID=1185653 RepID=A0ABN4RKT4_9BACL|nr:ABC transporter ATP-binding protein [Planococcus antarcticus]ANU11011.1 ABC transporter [Planococcus antarcticus DSM 14505]
MNDLRIINIEKQYQQRQQKSDPAFSLQPLRLTINEGEFFSLLGPSGCGKTTLLKLVAGLMPADNGEIWVGDANVTTVPPEARRFAMVFQQSLLFPHMSVEDNVAFGLKMQKVSKKQRLVKAQDMLEHVGLKGYGQRFPDELSGGQQQRVALARALVANPQVLLMDEPFSALDPSLREEMRELLSRIQKEFRVTVLFVTHDREEAFYLSDRIGVMSEGALLQVGKARELHERPTSSKVASFLGLKNIIKGSVTGGYFTSKDNAFSFPVAKNTKAGHCFLILRPEVLQLVTVNTIPHSDSIQFSGVIQQMKFNHGFYSVKIKMGNYSLACSFTSQQAEGAAVGQEIDLMVSLNNAWLTEE